MKRFFKNSMMFKALMGMTLLLTSAMPVVSQQMGTPAVIVDNQAVANATVTIAKVVSQGPGWLVIHTQVDGKPGPVIGYSPVQDGVNINVAVTVDTAKVTESLIAMLHTDAGTGRVYEFPGADVPVKADGKIVMSPFQVGGPRTVRIDMKARKFEFVPNVIKVKAGTPVELHIVSEDVAHGIRFQGLNINERLEKGNEVVARFTPKEAGRFAFTCSVYCGSDHRAMSGEMIVE